jgi:hypothetical protein
MKKLKVMDSSGDTVVEFEAGTEAEQLARELFERLTAKGAAVFSTGAGGDVRVKDFAELGETNIVVPAIVAG